MLDTPMLMANYLYHTRLSAQYDAVARLALYLSLFSLCVHLPYRIMRIFLLQKRSAEGGPLDGPLDGLNLSVGEGHRLEWTAPTVVEQAAARAEREASGKPLSPQRQQLRQMAEGRRPQNPTFLTAENFDA